MKQPIYTDEEIRKAELVLEALTISYVLKEDGPKISNPVIKEALEAAIAVSWAVRSLRSQLAAALRAKDEQLQTLAVKGGCTLFDDGHVVNHRADAAEKALSIAEGRLSDATKDGSRLEKALAEANEKIKDQAHSIEGLQMWARQTERIVEEQKAQIVSIKQERDDLGALVRVEKVRVSEMEADVASLTAERDGLRAELTQGRTTLEAFERQASSRIAFLEKESADQFAALAAAESENKRLAQALEDKAELARVLQAQADNYLAEVQRLTALLGEKDAAIRSLATSPVLGECRGCADLGYNVDWRRGDECVTGCFVRKALSQEPHAGRRMEAMEKVVESARKFDAQFGPVVRHDGWTDPAGRMITAEVALEVHAALAALDSLKENHEKPA